MSVIDLFKRKYEVPFLLPDLSNITSKQQKYLFKHKLMIGTPMYGGQVMGNYELSMSTTMYWAARLGVKVVPEFLFGATYLQVGRCYIARKFMESDCTHLLFIDADNGWRPNYVFELMLTQLPIVGGLYPRRKINWKAVHKAVLDGMPPEMLEHCSGDFPLARLPDKEIKICLEPQEVLSLPTGFLCIRRDVMEAYANAHPEKMTSPESPGYIGLEFFTAGVVEQNGQRGFDSEDNIFCRESRELGFGTWWCPWMQISHFGYELHEACYPCSNGHYIHKPNFEQTQR